MTLLVICNKCQKKINLKEKLIFKISDLKNQGWTFFKGQVHICDECNNFLKDINKIKIEAKDDLLTYEIQQPQYIKNEVDHSEEIPIDFDNRDIEPIKSDNGNVIRYRVYECRYCDFSKGPCAIYKNHEYRCIVGVNIHDKTDRSKAIYRLLKHEKEHSEFKPAERGKQRNTKWRTKKV